MPILRQHDIFKSLRDAVDRRNHFLATGHGERTTGTKIILHIDDNKRIAARNLHGLQLRMAASRIVRKPLMGADFPPDRLPRAAIPASSTSRDQRLPSPVCGER